MNKFLLVLVSAGAGSTLTLAVVLHYLHYLRTSGSITKDPKLKMGTIAMYVAAIVLGAAAMWLK